MGDSGGAGRRPPPAPALLELVAAPPPLPAAAEAAETVLEALLNGDPPLELPLNWRRRLADVPRTTPDRVSISFLRGHGLKHSTQKD